MSGIEQPLPAAGHAGLASFPPAISADSPLDPAQWGMVAFLVSEAALFATLLMTYATFMGADTTGPTPREALSLPLVLGMTACLLASSATIHFAESSARAGHANRFCLWWSATILLGAAFLLGTAYEWHDLIEQHDLTISRNLFGTTYYTLIGFHGLHVSIGILLMLVVLGLALGRQLDTLGHRVLQFVSWYWHFVDAVWIVVFTIVYVISR
jgi:cytochrome c oxidase subunit 3/cytochrome o ubiquinol oxidase subunit 3